MFKAKIQPKRFITVGGTLFCAWGIGYLMQSNAQEALPQESGAASPQVEIEPLSQIDEQPLELSGITLTSAISALVAPEPAVLFLPDAPIVLASLSEDQPLVTLPAEETAPTFACNHQLSAEPAAAAMVTLTLDAPCMVNDRFTIHHNGMMFTDVTDENGKRSLSVPALANDAVFIVSFSNGDGAVANASVTSLEYYDRVVVQWAGDSGVQIHALEFGADYDQQGHVWAGDRRDMSIAALGEGGFITQLGAQDLPGARMAEVYTFPSGTTAQEGAVRLSLEAEVTQANCGRDVEAQSIQLNRNGELKVQDVVLAIPDCDAVGDFLVLKNLLNDLKIARN
ncbi:hypothetical protein [uncultured Roseovarius sp.]|uniref:hypothetical protein n=1 Tax=uncultured Roseovarius sp. TaxID=293344 RepID=UPI0026326947|nr:hypothetical protein [uncultured Roseovarius sp.]